jgi:hypothetical protein
MKTLAKIALAVLMSSASSIEAQVTVVPLGQGIVFYNHGSYFLSEFGCPPPTGTDATPSTTVSLTYPSCSSKAPFTVSGDFTVSLSSPPARR